MLLEGLGVVCEVTGGLGVEAGHLGDAELAEELGQDDAADGVDRIDGHAEVGLTDGIDIDELEVLHEVDVALVEVEILRVAAQVVHVGEGEVAVVGQAHHLRGFCGGQELALLVEELEGVPLAGVMAGGDDDTAAGTLHGDGELGGRRGGQTDVEHVEAHTHQRTADHVRHHLARDTCVAAYDDFTAIGAHQTLAQAGVGRYGFGDVDGVEGVARLTADGTAETGNGFDKGHSEYVLGG